MGLVTLGGCFKERWFSSERQNRGAPWLGFLGSAGQPDSGAPRCTRAFCDCARSLQVPSAACSPGAALLVNTVFSKTLNADFRTAALELAPASPVSFLFAAIKLNKWDPGTLAGLQTRVKRIPNWPFAQKYNFQLWAALNFENHPVASGFQRHSGIVSVLQAPGSWKTKTNTISCFVFASAQILWLEDSGTKDVQMYSPLAGPNT